MMKPYCLLLFLLFYISVNSQNAKPGLFSVTDRELLNLIVESPTIDFSIASESPLDSDAPVVYYLYESFALYHNYFLRSVNQLREVVELKNIISSIPKKHPELAKNREALLLLAETYHQKAYDGQSYDAIFQNVRNQYDTLLMKATIPELTVVNHHPEILDPTAYKKELLLSAELIMQNLLQSQNTKHNRKSAEEGL
ncbi:hypothetical protein [Kaistella sp.]|uniref:hypothetical protein n=1 Tax=Kaistella sp. TaxID=2782235 RepID=UPI003C4C09AD